MSPPAPPALGCANTFSPALIRPRYRKFSPPSKTIRFGLPIWNSLRVHYATTLRHWFDRFEKTAKKVIAMYDEKFYRIKLEFYLISAEMMFRTGSQEVFHMQISKTRDVSPLHPRLHHRHPTRLHRSR